eukprot:CAMPEP_0172362718 /NCGR_PEP_ID=MMETSP1060-20121228/6258_1 /TAXON_ID=37318 /ORGANISM="Pseudo-nitzschia pungens, Strain cf. cingulata" /LENGTH=692 /DNA_ID=CAMNT_0013085279 /DNA_START=87 /DNA_END=2165 /DNA_ORIENTATION=-
MADEAERDLYEQSLSKTLLFTTSTSSKLQQTDDSTAAFTGLYRCTLQEDDNVNDKDNDNDNDKDNDKDKDNDNDNDNDHDLQVCVEATRVATGKNFDGAKHTQLVLRNLQFDLSSLREASLDDDYDGRFLAKNENENRETETDTDTDNPNYLYANYHEKSASHDSQGDDYWEIVRARLPNDASDTNSDAVNSDGSLTFESVFKSVASVDWNECSFDCCIQRDYELMGDTEAARRFDHDYEYKHAYARTSPRSFAIDEHTGDLFLSWEGFYKECGDIFSAGQNLRWTLGVSRVDPSCLVDLFRGDVETDRDKDKVGDKDKDDEDSLWLSYLSFVRCTVPVSIAYQSKRSREVVLPNGGFAIVPSSQMGASERTFLLSVVELSSGGGVSRVWAVPEGGSSSASSASSSRKIGNPQKLGGTAVDWMRFETTGEGIWDGGSLRLNYNPRKGRPDCVCRTVFEAGIECLPFDVSVDGNGSPVVLASGPAEVFLTEDQTKTFCHLEGYHGRDPNFEKETTLATGLDVVWDPSTARPERIFFGCFGGQGGFGNFGSVRNDGSGPRRVLEHAFVDAVLFWPLKLEGTLDVAPFRSESPPGVSARSRETSFRRLLGDVVDLVSGLVCLVGAMVLYLRRRKLWRYSSPVVRQRETGFSTPYVELQNIGNQNQLNTHSNHNNCDSSHHDRNVEEEEEEDVSIL